MTTVEIAAMPIEDRLKLMESLWDSLCAQPNSVTIPAWHGEVLDERLRRLSSGEERASPWQDAKKRIRSQCGA